MHIIFHLSSQFLDLQGSLGSCVGPIIDVQMKHIHDNYIFHHINNPIFPAIYDAIVITRTKIHFRDGLAVMLSAPLFQYFLNLAFHDSYLFGCIHLIPACYKHVTLSREVQTDVTPPFSSVFYRHILR